MKERKNGVEVLLVGDLLPAGEVLQVMQVMGDEYPFLRISDRFRTADVVFANLECALTMHPPVVKNREWTVKGLTGVAEGEMFCQVIPIQGDPAKAPLLARQGISVVNLANNHILNCGMEGIRETLEVLDRAGIAHIGAGLNDYEASRPFIAEMNGLRTAFVGFGGERPEDAGKKRPGLRYFDEEHVRKDVTEAREKADFVIASFHWGIEGWDYPAAYQVRLAHLAVDCGAGLVAGHHAHVIQGREDYKGAPIFYGLGNFIYDHREPKRRESLALRMVLSSSGIEELEVLPVAISEDFQPAFVDGKPEGDSILNRLAEISAPISDPDSPPMRATEDRMAALQTAFLVQLPLKKKMRLVLMKFHRLRPRLLWSLVVYFWNRLFGRR